MVAPVGVLEAARSGDQLAALVALRDTLAAQIDSSRDPFGLPALAARLVQVLEQIAKLQPPVRKGTALDELARRRSARGVASGSAGAEGGSQRR
ncbi:MAG TPA: hypothetical protein VFH54_03175 [Mycobacteriales bacterium]|nr:hypothetical protein [Mycobacteriales bacterium]